MKDYGPGHIDYPSNPSDWGGGPVRHRDDHVGTRLPYGRGLPNFEWSHSQTARDIVQYTPRAGAEQMDEAAEKARIFIDQVQRDIDAAQPGDHALAVLAANAEPAMQRVLDLIEIVRDQASLARAADLPPLGVTTQARIRRGVDRFVIEPLIERLRAVHQRNPDEYGEICSIIDEIRSVGLAAEDNATRRRHDEDAPRWTGNTTAEQAAYDHFMGGSTKGDLYVHVKRGRLGIMKPQRSHGHAYAAWMAGRHLALVDEWLNPVGRANKRWFRPACDNGAQGLPRCGECDSCRATDPSQTET